MTDHRRPCARCGHDERAHIRVGYRCADCGRLTAAGIAAWAYGGWRCPGCIAYRDRRASGST
jgi:DNA-directed RNA polymerase subunit RPC12/RpoP